MRKFDRKEHVFESIEFEELVKDAVRFFNGTPVHSLPPPQRFVGAGVYSLYYTGECEHYIKYRDLNRLAYDFPIYVGKAVPSGWRQSRTIAGADVGTVLHRRLGEHGRNIESVNNIDIADFHCRFMIFEGPGSDMISSIEAALIKLFRPLWNTTLDGFGNHTPGAGRFNQAKSDWDVVHTGREWADKCTGVPKALDEILRRVDEHMGMLE